MKRLILFFIIICSSTLVAQEAGSMALHLKLSGIDKAGPPEIWEDLILITYKPNESAHHIGIAFAHEHYSPIHSFFKNGHGIYIYMMELTERKSYDYRLVQDGIWLENPLSQNQFRDIYGTTISRLIIPDDKKRIKETPFRNTDTGLVFFEYRGESGKSVYLAGNFNNWDPYMTRMKEIQPGIYQKELRLPKGRYEYYFLENGKKSTDPSHNRVALNAYGEEASLFTAGM